MRDLVQRFGPWDHPQSSLCFFLRGSVRLRNAFWNETVTFCAFVTPSTGGIGNASGNSLSKPPATCGRNSVLTRRFVCDLWLLFAKRAPPANFGSPLRTNGMHYRNIPWVCSLHGFIDHVYRFSCNLKKKFRKKNKKCVLEKIQDGGKSILAQMGVAYMERCVLTQGIQGKHIFNFPSYGSRVARQVVRYSATMWPSGNAFGDSLSMPPPNCGWNSVLTRRLVCD